MITAVRIATMEAKLLAGRRLEMSFAHNRTFELWTTFMPKRRHFRNVVNEHLYSLQVYPGTDFFHPFNPQRRFTKWALLEVESLDDLPEGMEPFELPA
ncbi:MAG: GyrI-like domain-containing protein, partial [Sphingobacteriales bacterium]